MCTMYIASVTVSGSVVAATAARLGSTSTTSSTHGESKGSNANPNKKYYTFVARK